MGILFVVGIGPGDASKMTMEADEALRESEVIAGYTVYTDLVRYKYPDKEYIVTGMRQEIQRCHLALKSAQEGRTTAMVCSGDAGVYGMAGIIYELSGEYPDVQICVIPGVTAALSGAAVLGAPLGHDFVVISLSDLLTPWEKIKKRLEYAAMADLCICLYNPSSRKRADYLEKACDIILRHQPPDLICGYVSNIAREGEVCRIMKLCELRNEQVDMFTTVFIGNTQTKMVGDKMVTPRGYSV